MEIDFNSIERLVSTIKKDFEKGENSQKEIVKNLLPPFNRFVKKSIENGDYEKFITLYNLKDKSDAKSDYIRDLADIFLEPVLPIDLQIPDKYKILSKYLAEFFINIYM